MIIASKMGDANASIPTTQPVLYQPMFAAHGKAKNEACLTFVSKAAMDENVKEKYGLEKTVVPVKGCRNIAKKIWYLTTEHRKLTVDPETYKVTVDGEAITPNLQRNFRLHSFTISSERHSMLIIDIGLLVCRDA